MMKRIQLILLFMLVLSGAVLLGTMPAGAQGTTNITGVSVDDGKLVTDISGQTPTNPCYNDPAHPELGCQNMVLATELWICNGPPAAPPTPDNPQNCEKDDYSTFGVAYNYWTVVGGYYIWIAGSCTANSQCGTGRFCCIATGVCKNAGKPCP